MKEMICICCPMGCRLKVYDEESPIRVEGNTCPRGAKYGAEEAVCPKRVVTSVVRVKGGEIAMVSVKTNDVIPKSMIFDALALIKGKTIDAPVGEGDVIVKDIFGTGVDFVATKAVGKSV